MRDSFSGDILRRGSVRRATKKLIGAAGLLTINGLLFAGCGGEGDVNGQPGIDVKANDSPLFQLANHSGAVVIAPHETRFTSVARPQEVPKIKTDNPIRRVYRGFEHNKGVGVRPGRVYFFDTRTDVDQASSDDDILPVTEQLNNSYACDVHYITDLDPVRHRIVALSIDPEGRKNNYGMVIWQRDRATGEVSNRFALCFAEGTEAKGMAVAVVALSESAPDVEPSPVVTTPQ